MAKVFLAHESGATALKPGENIVGRGLECRVRFNDSGVSRRHMRIFVSEDRVVAEDLQTTNGSTLNDEPLVGVRDLRDGDRVGLGSNRVVTVRIVPGDPELLEDPPPPPSPTPDPTDRVEGGPGNERCPECGEPARHDTDACVACGFIWPTPRPGVRTVTGRVDTRSTIERGTERRQSRRIPIDVTVRYASESLSFESVATDLSRGGTFIATTTFDAVGTTCTVTLLPDGWPAIAVPAVVCRVERGARSEGRSPGMGVTFGSMPPTAHAWLVAALREAAK